MTERIRAYPKTAICAVVAAAMFWLLGFFYGPGALGLGFVVFWATFFGLLTGPSKERVLAPPDHLQAHQEAYPLDWHHAVVHIKPSSGEIHADGDYYVRTWLLEQIDTPK